MNARPFAIACLLAVFTPWTARADADLEALLSESVESTASKSAGTSTLAPALSTSIQGEDLRRFGIQTLAEAYDFLTVGLVSQDPLDEPEVGARGVMFTGDRGSHVLLLIDGHTMNDQENGTSLHGRGAGIPIELIDHIEVVLGPGSVLYGSNAMFGVVNVVTKRAKDFAGVHVIGEASYAPAQNRSARPTVGSGTVGSAYRVGVGAGYQFEIGKTPAELTTAVEYYTMRGPSMVWGPQARPNDSFGPRSPFGSWEGQTENSYYARVPSGYARLVAGEVEALVHVVASRQSSPTLRRIDQSVDSAAFDDGDGAHDWRSAGAELKWNHNLSRVVALTARVYGDATGQKNRTHEYSFFGCVTPGPYQACGETSSGYSQWLGSEVQSSFDWTSNGTVVSMVGIDARLRRVGYENTIEEVESQLTRTNGKFDRSEKNAAVFGQQVYRPVKWLTLNAGARLDIDDRFGNRMSPRVAVVAETWEGGTIKAIYAEAFRAPSAEEQNFTHPLLALAAGDLRPETVRSAETILLQRFGGQNLFFGIFRSWWTNMVLRRELHDYYGFVGDEGTARIRAAKRAGLISPNAITVFQYQNIASVDNFGFNGGYSGTALERRLSYGFNITAAYARLDTPEGERLLTVTPSMFGNARIAYDFRHGLPTLGIAAHFSNKRLSDAGQDAGFSPLPYAPPALDLRTTVTGAIPAVSGISYRVSGNYGFGSRSPYTAGPWKTVHEGPQPELVPANRFGLLLGLQYDL